MHAPPITNDYVYLSYHQLRNIIGLATAIGILVPSTTVLFGIPGSCLLFYWGGCLATAVSIYLSLKKAK
jgi:hypothetical protein